MKKVAYIL